MELKGGLVANVFEWSLGSYKWLLGCCYAVTECSEWSLGGFWEVVRVLLCGH